MENKRRFVAEDYIAAEIYCYIETILRLTNFKKCSKPRFQKEIGKICACQYIARYCIYDNSCEIYVTELLTALSELFDKRFNKSRCK